MVYFATPWAQKEAQNEFHKISVPFKKWGIYFKLHKRFLSLIF